jgi:hypothetical protein
VKIAEDVNDVDRDVQIEDKTKAGPLLFVIQALTSLFSLFASAYVFIYSDIQDQCCIFVIVLNLVFIFKNHF